MAEAEQLRAQYPTFTYQEFSWKLIGESDLELQFLYQIKHSTDPEKTISFQPSLKIHGVTQSMVERLGEASLSSYAFSIGMAELFSYWKTTASPTIEVAAGYLNQEQITFWHKLLLKGMGEFFYQNNIAISDPSFVKIVSTNSATTTSINSGANSGAVFGANSGVNSGASSDAVSSPSSTNNQTTNNQTPNSAKKVLIPIGGGKDSAATLEILKKEFTVGTYTVSAPEAAQSVINASNIPQENQIRITRELDPKLFELNSNGFLNGHVPISAYLAFVSILTADLFEYGYVAISNERSSNEGNVWYCDQEINHQYSKTYEFERDLQAYATTYLPKNAPFYFSFLRPLYELQIAQLFTQFTQHHPVFRSCNRGQKQNIWCTECSKCLFAWTILFPFLGPDKLTQYFGNNLFENENLWTVAQELLGLSTTKPFDCVGTHEESILAFYLCTQYYLSKNLPLPPLLQKVHQELETNPKLKTGPNRTTDYQARVQALLTDWNAENSLPPEFTQLLQQEVAKSAQYGPNS